MGDGSRMRRGAQRNRVMVWALAGLCVLYAVPAVAIVTVTAVTSDGAPGGTVTLTMRVTRAVSDGTVANAQEEILFDPQQIQLIGFCANGGGPCQINAECPSGDLMPVCAFSGVACNKDPRLTGQGFLATAVNESMPGLHRVLLAVVPLSVHAAFSDGDLITCTFQVPADAPLGPLTLAADALSVGDANGKVIAAQSEVEPGSLHAPTPATATPSATQSPTLQPTTTPTASATLVLTTPTAAGTPVATSPTTPTPVGTPVATSTTTPTLAGTPGPTGVSTPTRTAAATSKPTLTPTAVPALSQTVTQTPSATPTGVRSGTPGGAFTATATARQTTTPSVSFTASSSPTAGGVVTPTPMPITSATTGPRPTSTGSPAGGSTATPGNLSTASPTPVTTAPPIPTASPTLRPVCTGDCDGMNGVDLRELVLCLKIVNGNRTLDACPACDSDHNGPDLRDLVRALKNANDGGCR